jgi:hypothetical protein
MPSTPAMVRLQPQRYLGPQHAPAFAAAWEPLSLGLGRVVAKCRRSSLIGAFSADLFFACCGLHQVKMPQTEALSKLKASRDARATKYSAAQSHLRNDEYLGEFERAWKEMHGEEQEDEQAAEASTSGRIPAARSDRSQQFKFTSPLTASVVDGWLTGPVDEQGVLSQHWAHARNTL